MANPRATFVGSGAVGFRVEFVRSRGVLRIAGWDGPQQVLEPVEVEFAALARELGIELPAPSGAYLLFGGPGVSGGSYDCLGAFPDHASAKQAFTDLRKGSVGGWAEVVQVVGSRLVQVCWYGLRHRELRREPRRFLRRA